jgi:uncharacterized protein (DUF433 family)
MAGEHIECREGVYYVIGTRISLDSIVCGFREGCSPETILKDFEGLTLPHVYGAITYCLDHQAEVEAYLLRRRGDWQELKRRTSAARECS